MAAINGTFDLEKLRPTSVPRVMDLVEEVGHDISDWSNFKGGEARAASNPKYCYEWAFYEPGSPIILSLWHSGMVLTDEGVVVCRLNMRALSSSLSAIKGKKVAANRAFRFDEVVKHSVRENLAVRVIVCEGSEADVLDPNHSASKVEKRKLDDQNWSISEYDLMTGDIVIQRVSGRRFVDQHFSLISHAPSKREFVSSVYDRQRKVRDEALERSNGFCEYCSEPGFRTTGGYQYLETHHVIPLSEGGEDSLSNVLALCPNDHRRAHYADDRMAMRSELLAILRQWYGNEI